MMVRIVCQARGESSMKLANMGQEEWSWTVRVKIHAGLTWRVDVEVCQKNTEKMLCRVG